MFDNIKDLSLGLVKASEISQFNANSNQETLFSFGFFSETVEFVDDTLVVNMNISDEFKKVKSQVNETISKLDDTERKELLVELLSKEMKIK